MGFGGSGILLGIRFKYVETTEKDRLASGYILTITISKQTLSDDLSSLVTSSTQRSDYDDMPINISVVTVRLTEPGPSELIHSTMQWQLSVDNPSLVNSLDLTTIALLRFLLTVSLVVLNSKSPTQAPRL